MKYPGGYQIIDLKGLEITGTATTIDDPEIIEKLKYAFQLKKPLYITNYTSIFSYPRGPLLMGYNGDSAIFSHEFFASGSVVAYIELNNTVPEEDEYTIIITEI